MLRTRLWMGALLVALVVGVLVFDQRFAPWYPFLFLITIVFSLCGCVELRHLLDPLYRPRAAVCYPGVALLVLVNWVPHVLPAVRAWAPNPWSWVAGTLALVVLSAFVWEMAVFKGPGYAVQRMALTTWTVAYLGLCPSFLVQLRFQIQDPPGHPGVARSTLAVALAIFVPKFGDVGAYFTGRFLGRHRMTPVLSPKKTWEGFVGGMAASVLTVLGLQALGPVFLDGQLATVTAIGCGLVVGLAGILGDLAESLIKRDCQKKDASQILPGFGGILDVVDSIIFAAPVVYGWFWLTN